MPSSSTAPNFTISAAAKAAIAQLRDEMTALDPGDPLVTAMVAWGESHDRQSNKKLQESVVVSFYPQSMSAEIAHGVVQVSGIPLVFFVTETTARHFDGKVLDFADDRWFFLRNP
jgi:hypothetical protein